MHVTCCSVAYAPVITSGSIDWCWRDTRCCSRTSAGLPDRSSSPIASRPESRSRLAAASAHTRYEDRYQRVRSAARGRGGVFNKTRATRGVSAVRGRVSQTFECSVTCSAQWCASIFGSHPLAIARCIINAYKLSRAGQWSVDLEVLVNVSTFEKNHTNLLKRY